MDHTTITSSPTFCVAPWTGLNIDQTGRVFPCMHTGYTLGNIKEQDINEILVDKPIQELKNSMRCGEWHEACRWCKELEETTGTSGRTQKHAEPEILASINADIDWFEPQHMTINWSNLCNLTCVYCNPETSTAWQSVEGVPINFVRNGHKSLLNIMKQKGHALQGLTLGGGEPLLQKGLVEMLQCLDPQKVNVLLTTNLSVEIETNEIYQELKTWPNVSWMVSFDNADKDKFEYVRDRASWPQLEKNIQTLKRDSQHVIAHPAYSIYNAFDLVEYYEYCEQHDLDIFWCELTHPWDLDARRLPLQLRQHAVEEIDKVIERWSTSTNLATTTLENYRKQLVDNSYIFNINEYTIDVIQWHKNIEQKLNKSKKFVELWSIIAKEISNGSV
jgi:radical SAM protein with 4Fe4S-binding SPASM domain